MSSRPQYSFQRGTTMFRAGMIAIVAIAIVTWFAFTKDIPGTQGYRVQAVVKSANLLQQRSPVRIAGVQVGEVVSVGRYKNTKYSLVTMQIQKRGLPIHKDATIKIRPRLFLEGNFFAELRPGTPAGGELKDGGILPVTQTATPVQLDQILTSLQSGTRADLQKTVKGLGGALNDKPSASDDAQQDPDTRGLSGGQALNAALADSPYALRDGAISVDALLGENRHDLSRTIRGAAKATGGLARNEQQLSALVSELNTTLAATASRAPELEQSVKLLGPTAANLRKGLNSVDRALPPTRRFARDLVPGIKETPATIAASDPWLAQAGPLFSDRELGGLLDQLTPVGKQTAELTTHTIDLVERFDALAGCSNKVLIPMAKTKVRDGEHTSGVENYKEFWSSFTGMAGESQGFDGNGNFLRIGAAGGANEVTSGNTNYSREPSFASATSKPLRTSPAYTSKAPALRRDVRCATQSAPDVNGPGSVGPADGSRPRAPAPVSPKREAATAGPYDQIKVSATAKRLVPLLKAGDAQ